MDAYRILVVDDEAITRENLVHILTREGYDASAEANGLDAVERIREDNFDLILTDLRMDGLDGLGVLEQTRRLRPETEVIVITGYASVENAVEAMQRGAYHYISKPIKIEELRLVVKKALEKRSLKREVAELRRRLKDGQAGLDRIIGQSPKMRALKEIITQVAQLDCNVLITGETGTGKELVARTLHDLSPRAGKRFMAVNCGAFSEDLITNELFGHEPGAFTGADRGKKGILEAAEGGTVLLDEIGELPLSMQVKLLRVLQERSFMRVGGTRDIPVDIRVLAATNKDLKKEMEMGSFRQDLYYRLDVVTIRVPNLTERREDIPLLVRHFLSRQAAAGSGVTAVSDDVLDSLAHYEFPGNVRELENIIARAAALCDGPVIEPRHLTADLRLDRVMVTRQTRQDWPTLEENERRYITAVMEEAEGNKTQAAQILGIDRVSLWRKLKRFEIKDEE